MADKKISLLTETTEPAADDLFTMVDDSVIIVKDKNRKIKGKNLPSGFGIRTGTATNLTTSGQSIIGVTDTSVVRTITLSTVDTRDGKLITIQDESGAAGTNAITIDTQGSELINGAATTTISSNYGSKGLYSDGTNWFIIF